MTEAHDNDCLHCVLWQVIHKFCRDHPNGYVEDVLVALADVIGDTLMRKQAIPRQGELLREVNRGIRERITYHSEHRRKG